MIGALESRAASREATTVEEEVTFCKQSEGRPAGPLKGRITTHDRGNGELVLLCVFEEIEHVVSNDNTALTAQDILGAHCDLVEVGLER